MMFVLLELAYNGVFYVLKAQYHSLLVLLLQILNIFYIRFYFSPYDLNKGNRFYIFLPAGANPAAIHPFRPMERGWRGFIHRKEIYATHLVRKEMHLVGRLPGVGRSV